MNPVIEMFESLRILEIKSIIQNATASPQKIAPKLYHTLIFRLSGTIQFFMPGKTFVHNPGELVIMPRGIAYEVVPLTDVSAGYLSVGLDVEIPGLEARVFPISNRLDFPRIVTLLQRYMTFPTPSNRYRCLAALYEVLAAVSDMDKFEYHDYATFRQIEPAVTYMEQHMFDPSMKIGELHRLCGISDTYFRRLFVAQFGVSPKKYVINKRITQAKSILDGGEFSSIGEVAALSGFDDPLYFSKVFKQTYGAPPSEKL